MTIGQIVEEAQRLAVRGLRVIPLRPLAKTPMQAGWQELATSNPDESERLIRQFTRANLGVTTGEGSGVFVLDVDTKAVDGSISLEECEVLNEPLPATWRTDTPSAGGSHYWFRYPIGRRIGNRAGVKPGLDIRGEGGFVVVPPSVTEVGSYRWRVAPWDRALADAPDWLIELACSTGGRPGPRQSAAISASSPAGLVGMVTGEVRRQAERVANCELGERNSILFKAAAVLGELVGAAVLRRGHADAVLEMAAEECGLVRDDGLTGVLATINSGLKHGMAQPRRIEP